MRNYLSKSSSDTRAFAKELAKKIKPADIIAFKGGLGAGKTTFVSGLIEGLGIKDAHVSSPTFAIMNEYKDKNITVYHFDMYRINSFEDLYSTGFFDFTGQADSITLVEWSENIFSELPDNTIFITLELCAENPNWRNITVEGV